MANEEVKAEVDKKQALFKIWLKTRTVDSRQDYTNQRKIVNRTKRKAKEDMWTNIGQDLENDVQGTKKLFIAWLKGTKIGQKINPKMPALEMIVVKLLLVNLLKM
jgi:hypothetical protein